MASPAQITANRQNPLRHGLTAKTLVLATEDQAAFDRLRATLRDLWQPRGEHEQALVDTLAEAQWRLARIRRAETAFFDELIAAISEERPDLSPDQAMAHVFVDPEYRKRMSLFLRYQTSVERAVRQARTELEKVVAERLAAQAAKSDFDRAATTTARRQTTTLGLASQGAIADLSFPGLPASLLPQPLEL